MFHAGGHDIDTGGVDGTMPQDIRQFGDVLFDAIEGTGEQLSKIMWEHLGRLHPGRFAQLFHCRPNVAAV